MSRKSPGGLNLELLKDLRVKQWEHNHFLECMNVITESTHTVKSHLRENAHDENPAATFDRCLCRYKVNCRV